ncbi:MAG TPA: xanthine dehydrogenase family protein molybdopterin-binding subunit [Burkholderiales bacterium]
MSDFKGRREDDRLLTGQGRYTADWNLPGQLYAHFLRSDHAHAKILSLKVASVPGVTVLTGEDTKDLKTPPAQLKIPGRGQPIKVPHRPTLAQGRVRFVGEAIALVVADSPQAAQDAAERIEVEYEDLPAVVSEEISIQEKTVQLHDGIPGNLAFDFDYGDEKAAEEAIARASHVARVTVESTRLAGNPMEPRSCLAAWDAASNRYDVYCSSQGLSMMAPTLHTIMGLPPGSIRVHARDVGGGFGIRSQPYPEYGALMVAARRLGRPVKWTGSRFETIASDHHGRAAMLTGALALDRDGRFIGLRLDWICNLGAYATQAGPMISTVNPAMHAINAYDIRALYGRNKLVYTNTTPTTAYRGAGRPNVTYLVERLVDEAARQSGIDPIELRRRNLIQPSAHPYKTPTGSIYDSGDFPALLKKAVEFSEWSSFEKRRSDSRKTGKLRGIGCAMFVEPSGQGPVPKEEAMIKFGESGNAELYTLSGSTGQGHETVYPEIVGELLGLAPETITLRASEADGPALAGGGTVGSRSTMQHGGALAATAYEVIKKATDLAAKDLEVSPADLEFSSGVFRVKGTDVNLSMKKIIERHSSALDTKGFMTPQGAFPSGAHIAEVEIDPETGVVEVLRYTAVDDAGRVINHTLLEGQLHGGVLQGIGQALGEHVVYDETGQLLTGTFMDYPMPRASDQPRRIDLFDHSVPSPTNLLGAKGAGEAGTVGAVPAMANAVLDALRPRGIHELDFPYSPARIWEAIGKAG